METSRRQDGSPPAAPGKPTSPPDHVPVTPRGAVSPAIRADKSTTPRERNPPRIRSNSSATTPGHMLPRERGRGESAQRKPGWTTGRQHGETRGPEVNWTRARARAFSFSRKVGMNPYQGEGFRDVGSVAAQGSGNIGVASPAHQGAGQVAKSCHHLGGVAGPYLGAVFVKGDVPYPMHPVLDVPMLPENPQQSPCPSHSRCHTGYRITHRCLCPSFHRPLPLYPAYPRFHEGRLCLRWGHPSPTVPALPA